MVSETLDRRLARGFGPGGVGGVHDQGRHATSSVYTAHPGDLITLPASPVVEHATSIASSSLSTAYQGDLVSLHPSPVGERGTSIASSS